MRVILNCKSACRSGTLRVIALLLCVAGHRGSVLIGPDWGVCKVLSLLEKEVLRGEVGRMTRLKEFSD